MPSLPSCFRHRHSSTSSMGWDNIVNSLPYGERFRKHRKWLQDAFASKDALIGYRPIQRRETYTLLSGLCDQPDLFMDHITRYVTLLVHDEGRLFLTMTMQLGFSDGSRHCIRLSSHFYGRRTRRNRRARQHGHCPR